LAVDLAHWYSVKTKGNVDMVRSIALVIGTISLLLAGLAHVSEAAILFGVEKSFSSASPDLQGFSPPLNGMLNIGSADSPVEETDGNLVQSVFVDIFEKFELGIGVNYSTEPADDPDTGLSPANVRALAATAFTVQGESPVPIPASIQLSGTFQGDISPMTITSSADIQLRVYEFDPDDLTSFDNSNAVAMDVSVLVVPDGEDLLLDVRFEKYKRTSDSPDELLGEGLWTGSETLEFDLPASGKGIFIELWGVSEIDPLLGDPEGAGFDFLNTATLDIDPPPGVTVTLATGQVFGQSNVIPEPSTIAIWSLLGLVGLGYGWRKKRRAA
jgi:hypothetical protein